VVDALKTLQNEHSALKIKNQDLKKRLTNLQKDQATVYHTTETSHNHEAHYWRAQTETTLRSKKNQKLTRSPR